MPIQPPSRAELRADRRGLSPRSQRGRAGDARRACRTDACGLRPARRAAPRGAAGLLAAVDVGHRPTGEETPSNGWTWKCSIPVPLTVRWRGGRSASRTTCAWPAYKTVEITGTSKEGIDHAVSNAISKASKTLRNLDWFEVTQIRGHIGDGAGIGHYQVTLKIGFRLED